MGRGGHSVRTQRTHPLCRRAALLARALVNSTDAGPTGSEESTMTASYEPGAASCTHAHGCGG